MADLVFKTAKKNRPPIEFTLDGHTYTFKPPKIARAVMPVFDGVASDMKAGLDWLGDGLSEEDNKVLLDRLRDPKDDFDFDDLEPIIEQLVQEMTGNPTS